MLSRLSGANHRTRLPRRCLKLLLVAPAIGVDGRLEKRKASCGKRLSRFNRIRPAGGTFFDAVRPVREFLPLRRV
jgi:hypothetical protein